MFILEYEESKPNMIRFIKNEYSKEPSNNVFIINKEGLIYNSDIVIFDNISWRQNPQKFCDDHYGIYDLYPIILTVNNISSLFKFNENNVFNNRIIAPKINTIRSLIN